VLIEIKTPQTSLLGGKYRQSFPPFRDLSGAISQVLEYRESLMHEIHALNQGQYCDLSGAEPRCVIIAGSSMELADDIQKRSFERFRERLAGVTLVTFDEVFGRIGGLIALFEGSDAARQE
jgi:hypothetical protein